tara:strand:- start:245 stop:904 length:660 start_codon:yes stop_codon:yes gene_type:complete
MHLDHKDPLVLSANYIDRVEFGPADIEITKVASTRSTSTAYVSFKQEGNIKIFATVTFTDFSKMAGLKDNLRNEPKFDPYETCTQVPYKEGFSPKLDRNLEKKYCSDSLWWKNPNKKNKATLNLYMGWKDGGLVDLFGLILFLDATTPPIYNKLGTVGWVPTLTLTSHIRNIPEPGPLKVIAKTEFITNNYIEEDREIWDSKGNLVGQSKQLAKLRIKK